MNLQPSEVKALAVSAGLRVLQPPTLRSEEAQEALREESADAFVVVAYGLILPKAVLDIPPLGCINVHFSLLPRWRGAAPVQWALLEDDRSSGVTFMQMDPGLDTGPVLETVEEPIRPDDTSGTLADRLSALGAGLLPGILDRLDRVTATPQPEEGVTYASKLAPEDAHIDWSMPAEVIRNRIRAFNPRPGAWTTLNGKRLKIWQADLAPELSEAVPGTVTLDGEQLVVDTGSERLLPREVQPEGRARMAADDFVRGYGSALPGVLG